MTNISVIVPSHNDWYFLEKLAESLFSVPAGCSFELVIVDDSTDTADQNAMRQALFDWSHILTPDERAYFTRACNMGLEYSRKQIRSDYCFLLNSDTLVTPGWGRALMETSVGLDAGIVGATCLHPDGRIQHAGGYGPGSHFGMNEPNIRYWQDRLVPWVTGAALCIRRDTLDRIGYLPVKDYVTQYDESDRDFCQSATLNFKVSVAVSAACVIYHYSEQAEAMRTARGEIYPRRKWVE
jgi:GT2 family glycosyltransferase